MFVRYTPTALRQLDEICAYIAKDNPSAAIKVRSRIEYVASHFGGNPEMGRAILKGRMRWFAVVPYPYLIYYRIRDGEVHILRIRHSARRRPAFHEPEVEFVPAPTF
jgi:toxin ParE1/3/4